MANLEARRIGQLDCQVVTSDQPPRLVCVFCHGFGAPPDDLVPIAAQLLKSVPELLDQVQIVFPGGPLSLADQGLEWGRAWWPLDMARLQRAIELGEFRNLRDDRPKELPQARAQIEELLDQLRNETGLPTSRFLLGGFSQGSMLATDVALRLSEPPAGLVIWSGSLLDASHWTELAPSLKGTPVIQSHGLYDPILPFEAAVSLRDLLRDAGADVTFIEFPGPHTIPTEAIRATGELCQKLLGSR